MAQLDPENAARQCAVGDLAERLGKIAIAARAFLRAGQLSESSDDPGNALELLKRAHKLLPAERSPALLYAQALLRRDDPAAAAEVLEPFAQGDLDVVGLTTLGEALMKIGALDRARSMFERLPPERPGTALKLFELAGCYLASHQDDQAVEALRKIKQSMMAARQENDFVAQLDALVESYPNSIVLAEFWAAAYSELNRETKYFDSLVRLFDMYLEAGNINGAGDALEKLVDIDPYDSRNQQRLDGLAGRADDAFLTRMRTRLGQVTTHTPEPATAPAPTIQPAADSQADHEQHTMEDLIVQAEIFIQYSLQAKAIERLRKIIELFPGEEERNERLRNLCQLANWWPGGATTKPPRTSAATQGNLATPASAPESVDTMKDLARISEISQSLYRLTSPRAILSASIQEMGHYLKATRCIAVIGPAGKPPQMASEFCAPGIEPAPGALLVRLLAQLEHASPDRLGGLPIDAAAAPLLRELGLETALAVILTDPEIRAQAGMVIAGHATPHAWRPHETYFLPAVGDQMLLGVNHIRLRNLARRVEAADEKTGLMARSLPIWIACWAETQRAKSQNAALSLAPSARSTAARRLMRLHGEAQIDNHMEQLASTLSPTVRQADIAVKNTPRGRLRLSCRTRRSQALIFWLRNFAITRRALVKPSWNGAPITFSASVTEAVARTDFDTEDIVTELINRAEAGLQEAHQRGGNSRSGRASSSP